MRGFRHSRTESGVSLLILLLSVHHDQEVISIDRDRVSLSLYVSMALTLGVIASLDDSIVGLLAGISNPFQRKLCTRSACRARIACGYHILSSQLF